MKPLKMLLWLGILVVVVVYPKVVGILKTNLVVEFAIAAAFAVSLNLLLSYTGLLSFGHALFFGTGAYTTALALTHVEGMPLLLSILVGGMAAGLLALIISPLLVRATGTAFAMLTLAFGQLMFVLCLKFREVTGGEDGLAGYPVPPLTIPGVISIDVSDPTNFYYFTCIVLGLSILAMWYFTKTPLGAVMVSIRDNAQRVDYLGFRVPVTKAIIFAFSGVFAGIAGAMFALFQNVVSTDGVLHVLVSFMPIMCILVGGLGTFSGPIWGSGILILLEECTLRYTERAELVAGVIFVLVILFMPMGFVGLWNMAVTRWRRRTPARQSEGVSS